MPGSANDSVRTSNSDSVRDFARKMGVKLTDTGLQAYRRQLEHAQQCVAACEHCRGLEQCGNADMPGYSVSVEVAGQVLYFPQQPCRYLRAQREQERAQSMLLSSRVPQRYRRMTFANYRVTPANQEAYSKALAAAEGTQGLMLSGGPGTGKTHLAMAVANARISAGRPAVFVTVPELMDDLRQAMRDDRESELMDVITECELLILDDLGAENATDWVMERLFLLINSRYMHNLQTVVTSNYNPPQLTRRMSMVRGGEPDPVRGKRIVSRLGEMCAYAEVGGDDHRMSG